MRMPSTVWNTCCCFLSRSVISISILVSTTVIAANPDEQNPVAEPAAERPVSAPAAALRLEVAENSPPGTVLGPCTADTSLFMNFRIAESDCGRLFIINAQSGILSISDLEVPDAERQSVCSLLIEATLVEADDPELREEFISSLVELGVTEADLAPLLQRTRSFPVEVRVIDLPENPQILPQRFLIAEHSFPGTLVGRVTAEDPDYDDHLSFSLIAENQPHAFHIDADSGELRVSNRSGLDFERISTHLLRIRVTDRTGLTSEADITVELTDLADTPILSAATFDLPRNAVDHTPITRLAAIDPDREDVIRYQLLNDPTGGAFELDQETGDLTVADAERLSGWRDPECRLLVRATDRAGLSSDAEMTLRFPTAASVPDQASAPGNAEQRESAVSDKSVRSNAADDSVVAASNLLSASRLSPLSFLPAAIFCIGLILGWMVCALRRRRAPAAASETDLQEVDDQLEQQLLSDAQQLHEEIHEQRQTSTRTASLEKLAEDQSNLIELLRQELQDCREELERLEAAGSVDGRTARMIHRLRSEVDQRDQLIDSLRNRFDSLKSGDDPADSSVIEFSDSSPFESSPLESSPLESTNGGPASPWDIVSAHSFDHDPLDERHVDSLSAAEEFSPDHELLDARHRLEHAKSELESTLPGLSDNSAQPASATLVVDSEEADADAEEQKSPIKDLRGELAELFAMQKRDVSAPAASPASESQKDFSTNEADPGDLDHDDFVRRYMSKLLNKQDYEPVAAPKPNATGTGVNRTSESTEHSRVTSETAEGSVEALGTTPAPPRAKIDVDSLRDKTNSFRQIALQSVEVALASHLKRKARIGLTARSIILILLLVSAVMVVNVRILKSSAAIPIGGLLGVLAVLSAAELILRLRSVRRGGKTSRRSES